MRRSVVTKQDLKSIFDPVVDEIREIIAAQLTQVLDRLQLLRTAPSVACALGLGFRLLPLLAWGFVSDCVGALRVARLDQDSSVGLLRTSARLESL
jgi:hypothetical protein